MAESHPDLFTHRPPTEVAFLPVVLPDPLTPQVINWEPLLPPARVECEPVAIATTTVDKLRSLPTAKQLSCEFDCFLLPGGSSLEKGRPCYGRAGLLVEQTRGLVIGVSMQSGALPLGNAAVNCLTELLGSAQRLPKQIRIRNARLVPALQPLCDALAIQLSCSSSLTALDEAAASLVAFMSTGMI